MGAQFPVVELIDRLESAYGPPPDRERLDPVDELVACILSQHTTDATSFPTFDHLKEVFPTWETLMAAGHDRLVQVIARAGLANQKAKSIRSALARIHDEVGSYSLDNLQALSDLEARDWLTRLPGVGPKTATIVLCFSLGRNLIPVDTHVYRVSQRLGMLPPKTDANKAHDVLLKVAADVDAYRFHMDLIVHGRRTCKAPTPACERCVVTDLCAYCQERIAR